MEVQRTIKTRSKQAPALVVGGGPAGTSLLLAARQTGVLESLVADGLRIVERSSCIGRGELGDYLIRSDSFADSFLKPIDSPASPSLQDLLKTSAGKVIADLRGQPAHLPTVGAFEAVIAGELSRWLGAKQMNPFLTGLEALHARRRPDDSWITTCRGSDNASIDIQSECIVIATGANQPIERLYLNPVAGVPLLPRYLSKTVQSSELLGQNGLQKMQEILACRHSPKVAIVGGSHSALASAHVCMSGSHGIFFGPRAVAVLHRRTLRISYPSAEQALMDGYTEFGSTDICEKTGRVFPLAGFRSDSRELLRRHWRLGNLQPDDRLVLVRLDESRYQEANQILEEADMIVAALGYQPRALPLFDALGDPIPLSAHDGGPLVDRYSRLLNSRNEPIAGAFGIGLAAGYPLAGTHGEATFTGQANGLALWQSDIGQQLISQLLEISRNRHG